MAYVSNHRKWFGMGFPKKEILMDYVNRSYDPPKMKITGGVNAYVNRSCDIPKKEILMDYISIFGRHFPKITKKGYLMAYVSRSHNPPKKEILMAD